MALTVPLGSIFRSGSAHSSRELLGEESAHERLVELELVLVHPRHRPT
jgi:hypothetical protein